MILLAYIIVYDMVNPLFSSSSPFQSAVILWVVDCLILWIGVYASVCCGLLYEIPDNGHRTEKCRQCKVIDFSPKYLSVCIIFNDIIQHQPNI